MKLSAHFLSLLVCSIGISALLLGCGGGGTVTINGPTATLVTQLPTGTKTDVTAVAFRDGDGAWIKLQPSGTGTYRHVVTDPNERYSFAVVDQPFGHPFIAYYHATLDELAVVQHTVERLNGGNTQGQGAITNYSNADEAYVRFALASSGYVMPSDPSKYQMTFVPGKTHDLIGILAPVFAPNSQPYRMVVQRNVTLNGNPLPAIDFADGFDPEELTFTINSGNISDCVVTLYSAGGTYVTLGRPSTYNPSPTSFTYAALPSEEQDAKDLYRYSASTDGVEKSFYLHTPSDQSISLDGIPQLGAVTLQGNTVNWTAYPNVTMYRLILHGSNVNIEHPVYCTAGWLSDSSYEVPNISLAGWEAAWSVDSLKDAYVEAYLSNGSVADLLGVFNRHGVDGLELSASWGFASAE